MAATGIDLRRGNAYTTVATEEQAQQLEARGWVRASANTASDTTALNEFPSYLEDMSNPINPSFRGNGIDGIAVNTVEYLLQKSAVGMSAEDYQAAKAAIGNRGKSVDDTNDKILVVSVLPLTTSIDHTAIYVLTQFDPAPTPDAVPGIYTNAADTDTTWTAYTFA